MSRTPTTVVILLVWGLAGSVVCGQSGPPRSLVLESSIGGDEENPLRSPTAVAVTGVGEVAVTDPESENLLIFSSGSSGWSVASSIPLESPPLAIVALGGVYVVSLRGGGGLVSVDGGELSRWALPDGFVPGALAMRPDGALLVHDRGAARVVALEPEGRIVGSYPISGDLTALAGSQGGGFHAALVNPGRIASYGADGRLMSEWTLPPQGAVPAWPSGLAALANGDLVVVDRHGGRLLVLGPTGEVLGFGSRRGWDTGLLLWPAGAAAMPDGRVAIANQGNGRVEIFRPSQ